MAKMNHLGANGIVGAGQAISAGSALASKILGDDIVTVGCFGDGSTNEGSFHEALNFAATWKLPVVFVCENNLYSATTSIHLTTLLEDPAAGRASAYGCPGVVVDGNDVLAVNEAMAVAVERARSGEGPTLLELKTYRKYGHSRNDACGYRPKEEEKEWLEDRDPIKTFRARLLTEGVATEEEIEKLEEEVDAAIDDSVEFAKNSPVPSLESALEDIYAD